MLIFIYIYLRVLLLSVIVYTLKQMRSFDHAVVIFSINPWGRRTKKKIYSCHFGNFNFPLSKSGTVLLLLLLLFNILPSYNIYKYRVCAARIHGNALRNNSIACNYAPRFRLSYYILIFNIIWYLPMVYLALYSIKFPSAIILCRLNSMIFECVEK